MSWNVSFVEGKEYPRVIGENLPSRIAAEEVVRQHSRKRVERYNYYLLNDNKSDYVLPICYDNFKSQIEERWCD